MIPPYHLQNIRILLTEGFSDEELRRLCYDVPEFRPVYEQLAQTSGKETIIDRLLEHAERKILLEHLLSLAKSSNPARYEQHLPYQREAASALPEQEKAGEATAVAVYLHCFGDLPQQMPAEAHQLDWRQYFDSQVTPRRVPSPAIWRKVLLPQLAGLKQKIGPPNRVRLGGSASLAAGLAFGQTFKEVARYGLEVEQFAEGMTQRWRSGQKGPPEAVPPAWTSRTLPGQPSATDGAVIVVANPRQVTAQIVSSVGAYWGEGEGFEQGFSSRLKGVLVLEAEATGQAKRHLENWEAVALAQASHEVLRHFIRQVQPQKVHLFLAVPLALAVFLGHQWNALGQKVLAYEWVGGAKGYAPGGELKV